MKANKQRVMLRLDKTPDKTSANRVHRAPHDGDLHSGPSAPTSTGLLKTDRLTQQDIIQLQTTRGNQSVMRMLAQRNAKTSTIQRLPEQLEGAMGPMFDVNLSEVGIHTDSHANQVANDSETDATTIGNDIYFQQGAYRPGTADGNALIAREVSHIQRARMSGLPRGGASATATIAEKQDAQEVGGIVRSMGANPAEIMKPASGPNHKPSKAQRSVLQRDGYSHSRTAGIVTSKVVQGIFTTVLGPIGLIWRWPLIQKNLGEITGWEQFGKRKGKKDKEGNLVDKMRYGDGNLGTAMRWMASISEILKEFTIWLGFGTFIAAIVAAATHGAAAPVFLGLSIATAVTAGLHFLLRSLLVALNGYRLYKETKAGSSKGDLALIKHQMVSDGLEGIGAALAAVFGGLGAGGVTSAGGALASATGHGAQDSASKLAGFGLGAVTQGLGTSVVTNTAKEGGKDAVKPGSEKGFWEGFWKDGKEIKTAYETENKYKKGAKYEPKRDDDQGKVGDMVDAIQSRSVENSGIQVDQSAISLQNKDVIDSTSPKVTKVTDDVGKTNIELKQTQDKTQDLDRTLPVLVEKSVGGSKDEVKSLKQQVKEGLKKEVPKDSPSDSSLSPSDDSAIVSKMDDEDKDLNEDPNVVDLKRSVQRKGGIGSRIAGWFASKLGGLKAGVSRLNNKILAGVMKFAGKFNKSEADRKAVAAAMAEEKAFSAKDVAQESENDLLFMDFQDKAGELSNGVNMLAEMDK